MLGPLVLVAGAGLASWGLTFWVRRYAVAKSVLDHPDRRSSHSIATPRGGGLAIAIVMLASLGIAGAAGWVPGAVVLALGAGGAAIAAVGWIDDLRNVSPPSRAAVHFLAAGWSLYWLKGLPTLQLGFTTWALGGVGTFLAVLGVVWAINLYNFMDGIDGIASGEAASAGLLGALLLLRAGHGDLALIALLVAAACAGFLWWNWAPARIFLGDVGSGLLGFLFGSLAVASENAGAVPLLLWVLLLEVFVLDATVTLVRRFLRGERWYVAHRNHAYQRVVQGGWSHARVSSTVLAINLGLGLLALLASRWPVLLVPCVVAGAIVLAHLYWRVERWRPMERVWRP